MMRSPILLRSAGLAVILAAGSALPVLAADFPAPPPPMMPPPPMHAPLDVGGGFYLRGDVGLGAQVYDRMYNAPVIAGLRTVSHSIDAASMFGIGAGYQFNSWFRADATMEYRAISRFRHTEDAVGPPAGYNVTSGKVSALVGLANAYVDLGTWHRITPFIGLGAGFANIMLSGVEDRGYAAFAGGYGSAAARTQTNFAWAIHAGLGYDLSANWKAEAGYRYLNMGSVQSGTIVCTVPCANYHVRINRLQSHDVKFGLRYHFADAPMAAPAYAPGPLVRKY